MAGGRLFHEELDRLARARADFAFETTLSGLIYVRRLKRWKAAGYRIEITYLRLRSPQLALHRITARVRQGGHNVPRAPTCSAALSAVGTTSIAITVRLPTDGKFMTIRSEHRACWELDRELDETIETAE